MFLPPGILEPQPSKNWIFEETTIFHMGVEAKIGVHTPKWMVKIMENPIKMDDLGVPLFLETPIYKDSMNHSIETRNL